jgi:hypothetical protein
VVLPKPDYEALTGALRRRCVLAGLQPTEYFLLKTIQLYEMVVVRHGLMTVGQPMSGKTSALKMLAGAGRQASLGPAGPSAALLLPAGALPQAPRAAAASA